MKNADNLLKDIIKAVDTDGDGKMQYEGCPKNGDDRCQGVPWYRKPSMSRYTAASKKAKEVSLGLTMFNQRIEPSNPPGKRSEAMTSHVVSIPMSTGDLVSHKKIARQLMGNIDLMFRREDRGRAQHTEEEQQPGMRLAQQRRPEQMLNLARRSNVEALFASPGRYE
ncbi:hypothetical protein F4778DRAFT_737477 [Xylariomycetidae sp. FL2044]|nr:hypothetical protein F4778DRAFT_737477 [Xylariomycetidae sp. FL2044]